MRVWLFSDLHIDVNGAAPLKYLLEYGPPHADLCVVAGDLTRGTKTGVRLLEQFVASHMPVAYVPGNHEFYEHNIAEFSNDLGTTHTIADVTSVHCIDQGEVILVGKCRVLGCVLWTDYEINGDRRGSMRVAGVSLSDHGIIENGRDARGMPKLFSPADALERHRKSVDWLIGKLAQPCDIPTVVVTHHAPHPQSIARQFQGNAFTPAFVSDLSALIERWQPELWIHGHTHSSFDYMVGRTRVLCNPYGYGRENPLFDRNFVVEI